MNKEDTPLGPSKQFRKEYYMGSRLSVVQWRTQKENICDWMILEEMVGNITTVFLSSAYLE